MRRLSRRVSGGLLAVLLPVGAAHAEAAEPLVRRGLSAWDWAVVALYVSAMLGIGVFYSRRTRTSEEYYLGGRTMRPVMVGLSLFASLISTISYLAVPGEMMRHGPIYLTSIAAIPIIFLIIGYALIPYIMRLPVTSAYEILERRLGRAVRVLGSIIFLMIRLSWMGVVIYTASNVIAKAVGLGPGSVPYFSIVLGLVTAMYASMGGLRAVVLTDVIQAVILFTGALITIGLVTFKMGGFGWFPTHWAANWDTQPLFSLDPHVRVTVVGSILVNIAWWVCTAGSDQMAIQRYLATRDAKAARRAFLIGNSADAATTLLLAVLGFALLGFFQEHPEFLSPAMNLQENTDLLFPHFIVNFFSFGIAGLVISGMLAAAMSALSSGVNATCTVITTDLLSLFRREPLSEARKVTLAKRTAFAVGVIAIGLSLLVGNVRGNLIEITNKTNNLFVGPLFGLFFFALFAPVATPLGAVFGSLYGLLAAFLISFGDLAGWAPLSWQWIIPSAVVVDIVSGTIFSLAPTRNKPASVQAAWAAVFAIPFLAIMALFLYGCFQGVP